MLTHPTYDQLRVLKLTGMLKALQEQEQMPDIERFSFLERLGLLVDREIVERDNRRLTTRLRFAKLKQAASLEGRLGPGRRPQRPPAPGYVGNPR